MAKYEFVRIGGTASTTSAAVLFQKPSPKMTRPTAMSTRLGSARPTFETLAAKNSPRCLCPSQRPSGSAITSPIPIAANDSSSCSPARCSRKPTLSTMKRIASTNVPGWNWSASSVMRASPSASTA